MSVSINRKFWKASRPEKGSRRDLKLQADIQFSLFIRLRDGSCVLCGSTQNLECGHYIGRSNPSVRYHPLNAHCLCHNCNMKDNQDKTPYRQFYLRTYPEGALDELERLSKECVKTTDEDLKQKVKEYEDLVEILKDERSYL
jgi:hypothetical protein